MDKKALILIMMGVVIVLLLMFNARITSLTQDFQADCEVKFEVNATCPCFPEKSSNRYNLGNHIDFSSLNISKS